MKGSRRQQIGEHSAGDQQDAEQGRDEAVGDLPDGLEDIEPLAYEGNGFEQAGPGGGAHQRGRGGKRRVDQPMAECGEIGDGVAAVGDDDAVEVDELPSARWPGRRQRHRRPVRAARRLRR